MANIPNLTTADLKRAIAITEQIDKLQSQLTSLLSGNSTAVVKTTSSAPPASNGRGPRKGGRRKMSPESRARIAAAQRARWAQSRGTAKSATPAAAPKAKKKGRVFTPAGRAALSAAMKARWAARKKGAPALNASKK